MKILVTSIVDLKKSQHNRPHQFIKYLSKKHDVTVISINDWWKGSQDNLETYSKDFDDIFNRINYYYLTDKQVSPIYQEVFAKKRMQELLATEKFDVHLNYNTLISGYCAAKKINTVYDIADDLGAMIKESPQIPSLLSTIGGAYGDLMLKRNIGISKKISSTTQNLIKTYKIPLDKAEIIPNGVDTTLFKNYGKTAKADLGLNGFIIGYVGVLREWIDFESIFSALHDLNNDIKMVIVGKEGRFNETKMLAKKFGIEDRVTFTGMVPYSQVPKYISAMDVCVMPFKKSAISENAVPLKLFEYMSCEKPIISTKISGVEKIAKNKILFASEQDDIKNEITTLYGDEKLRNKLGSDGRKFVQTNYEWITLSEKMEKLLASV